MTNFELFIKTLVLVVVITAIPYAFAACSNKAGREQHLKNTKSGELTAKLPDRALPDKEVNRNNLSMVKPKTNDQNTLPGKWRASYPSMKMDAIYEIKKVNSGFKGHLVNYIDQQGHRYPENLLALTIQTFTGKQGKGIYQMKYEGKHYTVNCTLTLKNAQVLVLNYTYEGYTLKETWKRINK